MSNDSKIIKEIFDLKKENQELREENRNLRMENIKLKEENATLKKEVKRLNVVLSSANQRIKYLENKLENFEKNQEKLINDIIEKTTKKVTEELDKKHKKQVDELQGKISRLEKRLSTNSSNSGIPTSKDRIGTHNIQNNREKSENEIGAQVGHEIHKLNYFSDEEITETVEHTLECCPECGGKLKEINVVKSDIIDLVVSVTKTRNNIHNYKCTCCKKRISANNDLPRSASYGNNLKAIILSMMNEANTPLNKVASFISGITNNEVNVSEGYMIELQKKQAAKLSNFIHDLKEKVISLDYVFWDDTVVKFGIGKPSEGYDEKDIEYMDKMKDNEKENIKKVRNGVIRFYGDENFAYLVGHRQKNEEGIDADGILSNLSKDCTVMHDHVLLNYSDKYCFKNAECNEHVKRYLKGNMDMFPEHKWASQMREFLLNLKKIKDKDMEQGITCYSEEKIKQIFEEYSKIIELGYKENKTVDLKYILNKNDELNLIERLDKFKENHLMFITDFSVEFTNNTSEIGLRQVKRKIAVSFMFKNSKRMKDYATILSYLETCSRNEISRFEASKRLVCGEPYTITEISQMMELNKQKGEKK